MSRLPSQATLLLHGAGVTVTDVAHTAGIAQPSVSAQLAGRRLLQNRTLAAIEELTSLSVAEEIQGIVAQTRSRYLLEVQAGRL